MEKWTIWLYKEASRWREGASEARREREDGWTEARGGRREVGEERRKETGKLWSLLQVNSRSDAVCVFQSAALTRFPFKGTVQAILAREQLRSPRHRASLMFWVNGKGDVQASKPNQRHSLTMPKCSQGQVVTCVSATLYNNNLTFR